MPLQHLAWLNIKRQMLSSCITWIAIFLTVLVTGVLWRLYSISQQRLPPFPQGLDGIITAKNSTLGAIVGALDGQGRAPGFVPQALFAQLENKKMLQFADGNGIETKTVNDFFALLYWGKYEGYRVAGVSEEFWSAGVIQRPALREGVIPVDNELAVGSSVAEAFAIHVGDTIVLDSHFGNEKGSRKVKGRVSAILSPSRLEWDVMLFSNLNSAQLAVTVAIEQKQIQPLWGAKIINSIYIAIDPSARIKISHLFNDRSVAMVTWVDDARAELRELVGVEASVASVLLGLVIALGLLCIVGSWSARTTINRRTLLALRALGYTQSETLWYQLWEVLILGGSAVLCGAITDAIFFPILRKSLGMALPPIERVPASAWGSLPLWLGFIAIMILATIFPSAFSQRQDLHLSLRN